MSKIYPIYIGGQFKTTSKTLDVENPFNKEKIATTYLAGKEELEEAIMKASAIEEELKNLSSYNRYKVLMQVSDSLEYKKEELARVLSSEAGKPYRYALGEIDRATQVFRIAAEESKRLPKEYISLDWTAAGGQKEGWVKSFPIGLIAGIAPFNFPMNLAVHKIAPAIAAGNPIILKPARSTPLSVLELARIIDETALPKGALSILPMDREAGNQLVTDERIKMLSFTGSPEVGWKMRSQAGKKKVVLELGGNAGVIITETANLEHAVSRSIIGGFAYSGQVCIHAQRFIVQEKVFEKFINLFIQNTKKLEYGDPLNHETDVSSMIDEENAIRVESWVNEAKENGAKLLYGGNRQGSYYEPTIITNTSLGMKICSNEVFGPVVTIEKYDKFPEAVDYINNSRYGLQAGIFTNSISAMNEAFERIHAGGVIINDVPTFRVDHMPYGGVKDSGFGREGVKYSIVEMMEPKLMVKNTDY